VVTPTSKPSLHALNASMRRIDLISKFAAPIFISLVSMRVKSVIALAAIVGAQNAISTTPEWYSATRVWLSCPKLRDGREAAHGYKGSQNTPSSGAAPQVGWGVKLYFGSDVWIRTFLAAFISTHQTLLSISDHARPHCQ